MKPGGIHEGVPYICIYTHACQDTCIHAYSMHICTYICIYVYTYIYTFVIYTYICIRISPARSVYVGFDAF